MKAESILEEQIPKIGLGTWRLRGENCRESVLSALEMGYRHLDTAEYYRNEKEVGQAVQDAGIDRENLFLTSKVWSNHFQKAAVQQACEDSLKRLRVDYLDLYLIHHFSNAVPLEETLAGMQALVDQGKTRFIGVSNFSVSQLDRSRELMEAPIFTNQVEYHPFRPQESLLDYCQEHEVLLTAYSPLDRGRVLRDATLRKIGERYGKSAAQITLRWLVQQERVIAIPKAASKSHQRANLEVFDFQLTPEEIKLIDGLG